MATLLTDPAEIAERFAAGKAGTLAQLSQTFDVPPFVVIVAEEPELELSPAIAEALGRFIDEVGGTVAVRSSASVEDAKDASYAGMFDTVLGVSRSTVRTAVEQVRRSASNGRVRSYIEARGLDESNIHVAVIVQQLVQASIAGTAFSCLSADDDCVVIEAVLGLGESLVSGNATPDRYRYERESRTVSVEHLSYQATYLAYHDGEVANRLADAPDRNAQKLRTEQIASVGELALAAERHLGGPADIEWAFDHTRSRLLLLQARPYTGAGGAGVEATSTEEDG